MKIIKTTYRTDNVDRYFASINKYPLLNIEEEYELLLLIKSGNISAKQKIINSNLRFVVSIAKEYNRNQANDDLLLDLIQEGNMGLINCIDTYDITRGFKFITYAVWHIRQKITAYLHEKNKVVRIPVNKYNDYTAIIKFMEDYECENGCRPSTAAIQEGLGFLYTEQEISELLNIFKHTVSLDMPPDWDKANGLNLVDFLPTEEEDVYEEMDLKAKINFLLSKLNNPTYKLILINYYGLNSSTKESKTIEQIADMLKISGERVRQLHKAIISNLKQYKYLL